MESKHSPNLLIALKELDKAMSDNGGFMEIGLDTHLKNHKVGKSQPIAKMLRDRKIIDSPPDSTTRSPKIFWNLKERVTLAMCDQFYADIDADKSILIDGGSDLHSLNGGPKPIIVYDRFHKAISKLKNDIAVLQKALEYLENEAGN